MLWLVDVKTNGTHSETRLLSGHKENRADTHTHTHTPECENN